MNGINLVFVGVCVTARWSRQEMNHIWVKLHPLGEVTSPTSKSLLKKNLGGE